MFFCPGYCSPFSNTPMGHLSTLGVGYVSSYPISGIRWQVDPVISDT